MIGGSQIEPETLSQDEGSLVDESYVIALIRRFLGERKNDSVGRIAVDDISRAEEEAGTLPDTKNSFTRHSEGADARTVDTLLLSPEIHSEADQITAGCTLWDLTVTEYHATFLVENFALEVCEQVIARSLSDLLQHEGGNTEDQSACDRLLEISCGILANIASHASSTGSVVEKAQLSEYFELLLLQVSHPPILTETCRCFAAVAKHLASIQRPDQPASVANDDIHLSTESSGNDSPYSRWSSIIFGQSIAQRLIFILQNSLNGPLLVRVVELLLDLLYYNPSASVDLYASVGLPDAVLEALEDRSDLLEGTMVGEYHGLSHAMRILEIFSANNHLKMGDASHKTVSAARLLHMLPRYIISVETPTDVKQSAVLILFNLTDIYDEQIGTALQDSSPKLCEELIEMLTGPNDVEIMAAELHLIGFLLTKTSRPGIVQSLNRLLNQSSNLLQGALMYRHPEGGESLSHAQLQCAAAIREFFRRCKEQATGVPSSAQVPELLKIIEIILNP